MKYSLQNEKIFIEIESKWAEMVRFLYKNETILYEKHPDFWQRQSPVLFPIVGGLKDKKYFYKNKEFSLPQHGFARDESFELIGKWEDFLKFSLVSDGKFLEKYPFDFELVISYFLTENNVKVEYEVKNLTDGEMWYSIGGHPAFHIRADIDRYLIKFEKNMQNQVVSRISPTEFLLDKNFSETFPKSEKWEHILELDEKYFSVDAMIFLDIEAKKLDFCFENEKIFTFSYENFPHLGIWKQPNSPFICLEPWDGYVDRVDASGNLEEKAGIKKLEKWESWKYSWSVEF